ncbi:alkaline phosphatase D family protein [Pontibacter sp. G13]|uniref:alkaline phosphatase D family protein n=1 Tax=Pontibacter sp. G13 TaxID=3074898 RepID=UPI002889B25A|nr:alkaline phosphatase D family protein [Pontibacter sp. G13]WNJ16874.1 alkaline phosphatase D family protein [Pontibacter sp. G13]
MNIRPMLLALLLVLPMLGQAQSPAGGLLSGPMVGYSNMREVMLWVQTNGPANVQIAYNPVGSEDVFMTAPVRTNAEHAYTAHLLANSVRPGTDYEYRVLINGAEIDRPYATTFSTPPLWQYRTDPPAMKIALGSCTYINDEPYDRPGNPYGGGYEIFEELHKESADMMLWLGDNTYLREADWYSRTGIVHRYTHTRATAEMQALLASTANYAIWDDHDFGPNNSDKSFVNKDLALEAFQDFWANPSYGMREFAGTSSTFEWGDAQFFMLDNRYHRDPNRLTTAPRSILGEAQLEWFKHALVSSNAKFKFVMIGCQVLNSVGKYENYEAIAPQEREEILDFIAKEGIRNVIFLTGDRHHSEMSKITRDGIDIYDFTVSPLTSGSHNAEDEPNANRLEGSQYGERNYGIIELSGERKNRTVIFRLKDVKGKEVYTYKIEGL